MAITADDLPAVLSPEQVCRHLNIQTSRPDRFVRGRINDGLRVLKVGKALRVLRKDLVAYLGKCSLN